MECRKEPRQKYSVCGRSPAVVSWGGEQLSRNPQNLNAWVSCLLVGSCQVRCMGRCNWKSKASPAISLAELEERSAVCWRLSLLYFSRSQPNLNFIFKMHQFEWAVWRSRGWVWLQTGMSLGGLNFSPLCTNGYAIWYKERPPNDEAACLKPAVPWNANPSKIWLLFLISNSGGTPKAGIENSKNLLKRFLSLS